MSVVVRTVFSLFLYPALIFLIACSDSSITSDDSLDNRLSNLATPFVVLEGNDSQISTLHFRFTSTVNGSVNYSTFNVTAAGKSDYIATSGTIDAVLGEEYVIEVDVYGDSDIEGNELVGLSINFNSSEIDTLFGMIINDDLPSVSIKTTSVLEGDAGTSLLRFTFILDEEVVDPYEFSVVTPVVSPDINDPSNNLFYAIPGIDFQAVDQTITFTENQSEISIDVVVFADNIIELDEKVLIELLPTTDNGDLTETNSKVSNTGLIRTDDSIDINGFTLSSDSQSVEEGTSTSIDNLEWQEIEYLITVQRSENIIEDQIIQIKLEGSDEKVGDNITEWATLGQDYCDMPREANPVTGLYDCEAIKNYTLEKDTTNMTVSFYVLKDLYVEESEEIEIQIRNDQGITFDSLRHTIVQDDYPSLLVSYTDPSAESGVSEPKKLLELVNSVNGDFEIKVPEPLDKASESEFLIYFELENPLNKQFETTYKFSEVRVAGGISGSDYTVVNNGEGTIVFPLGSSDKQSVSITPRHDDNYEARETINLFIDGFGVLPITIIDNDLPQLEITTKSGEDVTRELGNLESIPLVEEPELAGDLQNVYDFSLELSGGIQALDDLDFSYKINDNSREMNSYSSCDYLHDDNKNRKAEIYNQSSPNQDYDYKILINNVELAPKNDYNFKQFDTKLDLSLVVNNDRKVECLEFISLEFVLKAKEVDARSNSLTVNFHIDNNDKAILKVVGWNTDEGSSDQTPLSATNKNFMLVLDQAIVTDAIEYTLTNSTNDLLSCGDDLQGVTLPYDGTVSFNGKETDLNKAIGVKIQQDNIIEPKEACRLSITDLSEEDSNVIDIQYFNETEKNSGEYAATDDASLGVIHNDDFLTVTVTVTTNNTPEPESDGATVSIGTYSWDKDIAGNVGAITLTATKNSCTVDQDCIEDQDTSFGSSVTQSISIHNGTDNQQTNSNSNAPLNLPIEIIGDSVVENEETLDISFSSLLGGENILDIVNANSEIGILNEDKLTLSIVEALVSSISNNGESGVKDYLVTWGDKSVSNEVAAINLNLNSSSSASRKLSATQTDYEYVITSSESEIYNDTLPIKGEGEALAANAAFQFELDLKDDDLVEIEEVISIALSSSETDFVSEFSDTKTHTIGIDDKLEVSLVLPNTYVNGLGTSNEEDEDSITYNLVLEGDVASDVPELLLDISFSGLASIGSVLDYKVSKTDDKFDGTVYTVKAENDAFVSSSDTLILNIQNDDLVELDENVITTLSYALGDIVSDDYIKIVNPSNTVVQSLVAEHTILDGDTAKLSLTQTSGSNETSEEDATKLTYRLAWDEDLPLGLELEGVTIEFTGKAKKGTDYSVSVAESSTGKLTIDNNTFTIAKEKNEPLVAGFVEFDVTIIDDKDVEITEDIITSITSAPDTFTIDDSNKSLTHNITDTDKALISLTGGSDTSSEDSKTTLEYTISWNDVIPAGVPSLTTKLEFTGTATKGTDYTVSVKSGYGGELTIDEATNTFTIKKNNKQELAKGSVVFEVSITNDTHVEITESINATLELTGHTGTYASLDNANKSLAHSITDTDTSTISLTGGTASSAESNEIMLTYTLTWNKALPAGLASQSFSLPFAGTAEKDSDYLVSVASASVEKLTIVGDTFTLVKVTEQELLAGSVYFEVKIKNDADVEVTESISAAISKVSEKLTIDGSNSALSHEITDTDKALISLTGGSESSDEDDKTALTYTLAWDKPLPAGLESQSVRLPFSGTATKDSDYSVSVATDSEGKLTISGNTFTIVKAANSLLDSGSVQFVVTVEDDSNVEAKETIASELTTAADQKFSIDSSNKTLAHNIIDTDTTALSITVNDDQDDQDDQDEQDESVSTVKYTLNWDANLEKGVVSPTVDFTLLGTASSSGGYVDYGSPTSESPDALGISGNTVTIIKESDAVLAAGSATFTMDVIDDSVIETDETIIVTLSNASARAQVDNAADSATYTIGNNDKIYLEVITPESTEPTIDTGVYLRPVASYIAEFTPVVNFELTDATGLGIASHSSDFTFNNISLPLKVTDASDTNHERQFITIKSDNIIELDEVIPLKLAGLPNYIDLDLSSLYIKNDDYLKVNTKYYDTQILVSQVETTQLQELGQYAIEFCLPSGYSIETGDGNLEFTATYSVSGLTGSEFLEPITDSDISVLDDSATATTYTLGSAFGRSIDLDTLTNLSPCVETPLINAVDNSETNQNKSFFTDFASDDVRCDGSCLDQQFLTIINDDLINVLDTGLDECIYKASRLLDVSCDDSGIDDKYQLQDAATTDFYPDLSFTYVNAVGESVQVKPTAPETCYQDNSTGLIWSQSSDLLAFSESATVSDCGLTELAWQIPTVQELMTIMELNPIGNLKPVSTDDGIGLNLLNLKSTGINFWEDTSRYWTSDTCLVGVDAGQWTIDFLTGYVECDLQTNTNYYIKVYK